MATQAHSQDADCTVINDECTVCGVTHGDPCSGCGGRGFHRDGCTNIVPADAMRVTVKSLSKALHAALTAEITNHGKLPDVGSVQWNAMIANVLMSAEV